MTTPESVALSTEQRNAIGHAATALGKQVADDAWEWLPAGHTTRTDRHHLTARLADYRLCCELAACTPNVPWVEAIEAAIALPEREG